MPAEQGRAGIFGVRPGWHSASMVRRRGFSWRSRDSLLVYLLMTGRPALLPDGSNGSQGGMPAAGETAGVSSPAAGR